MQAILLMGPSLEICGLKFFYSNLRHKPMFLGVKSLPLKRAPFCVILYTYTFIVMQESPYSEYVCKCYVT